MIIVVMVSLFIAQVIAGGVGNPGLALPIASGLVFCSFIPLNNDVGVFRLALNASDILYQKRKPNPGGITSEVYYAFADDIKTWPAALTDLDYEKAVTLEEIVTIPIADEFAFHPGKSFKKLYCTLETGELKYSLIGARDSKSFSNSMEVSYPSNDEKITGFVAAASNADLVFLVREQNGRVKVLGTPKYPAMLETAEGTTGKLIEDGNVLVQTYMSKSPIPAPVYKGPILLEAAVVPGG